MRREPGRRASPPSPSGAAKAEAAADLGRAGASFAGVVGAWRADERRRGVMPGWVAAGAGLSAPLEWTRGTSCRAKCRFGVSNGMIFEFRMEFKRNFACLCRFCRGFRGIFKEACGRLKRAQEIRQGSIESAAKRVDIEVRLERHTNLM
jgi:hypothetical protein